MTLPWYVKSSGIKAEEGHLILSLKLRKIYILWIKIVTFVKFILE